MPADVGVTNAGSLRARMRHRSEKYIAEVEKACRQNAEVLMRKAKQFSQRRFYSLSELRKMGHPYAVRDPRPPIAPHILNKQSGRLYASWRIAVTAQDRNTRTYTVYNTAPWAKYMLGTRLMIPRPIMHEALARTEDERRRNIKRARDRAYQRQRRV